MFLKHYPVIDPVATGENILRLRKERGLSVRELQSFFGFEEPQAIYKWQKGKSLPTVDNLYALSAILEVPMEDILVSCKPPINVIKNGQQAVACCPKNLSGCFEYGESRSPRHPLFPPAVCPAALTPKVGAVGFSAFGMPPLGGGFS